MRDLSRSIEGEEARLAAREWSEVANLGQHESGLILQTYLHLAFFLSLAVFAISRKVIVSLYVDVT